MPALILGPWDQPRSAREDKPGGGIGCEGLGEGPRPQNLTCFSLFLSRSAGCCALQTLSSSPNSNSPEPSFSFDFSLFWLQNLNFQRNFTILEFLGHRLPGYPHQTLENLQAKPYCRGPEKSAAHDRRQKAKSLMTGAIRSVMPHDQVL